MKYPKNHKGRNELIEDLLKKGYPLSSFVIDWNFFDTEYDLAIIDPKIKKPIAVFDSMGYQSPVVITSGPIRELDERLSRLRTHFRIPLIIYAKASEGEVIYYYYIKNENGGSFAIPRIRELPEYQELRKIGIISEKNIQIDFLKYICYFCTLFLTLLLVIDSFFEIITSERLYIMTLAIFLLIIPYATKLKFLGMSFERKKENKKPTANDQ